MTPRAVLFDLDGTLLDTLADLTTAADAALVACGYPPRTRDEIRRFVGDGARRLIERAVPTGATDVGRVLDAFRAAYVERNMTETRPYDGVPQLIDALLSAHIGVAVVSNKPAAATQALVRRWFPAVAVALGDDGIRPRKPAPDACREAARLLGVDAADCVYVGDSAVDLATAKAFGVPCYAVAWGFCGRAALLAAGATTVVDTAEQLRALLLG